MRRKRARATPRDHEGPKSVESRGSSWRNSRQRCWIFSRSMCVFVCLDSMVCVLLAEAIFQFFVTSNPQRQVGGTVSADVNQNIAWCLLNLFELLGSQLEADRVRQIHGVCFCLIHDPKIQLFFTSPNFLQSFLQKKDPPTFRRASLIKQKFTLLPLKERNTERGYAYNTEDNPRPR